MQLAPDPITVGDLREAANAVDWPPMTSAIALAAKFRALAEELRHAGPGARIGVIKEPDQ